MSLDTPFNLHDLIKRYTLQNLKNIPTNTPGIHTLTYTHN